MAYKDNFDLSEDYRFLIERAESIKKGSISVDKAREFIPNRNGDLRKFASETLQLAYMGTNREITGLWASPLDYLSVYVQAEENDPLPSILVTQHISNNQTETYQLKRGFNYLHIPYLFGSEMKTPVEHGGGIYIINPYSESEQSSNVKVYIEGGDNYLVYNKGENKNSFYKKLADSYEHYKNGDKGYHNMIDINTEHSFMTLTAERCYNALLVEGMEIDKAVSMWDAFIEYLLDFASLKKDEYKNVRLNVKTNQPYALAYATSEMVCIQDNEWAAGLLEGTYGWGFPHEVGHCLDDFQIAVAEVTNNMWSTKYVLDNKQFHSVCVMKNENDLMLLSNDDSPTRIWKDTTNVQSLSMIWDLEVYHNGYWADLQKRLRNKSCGNAAADAYIANYTNDLNYKKERLAIYSSAILGIDLTYYFKRHGLFTTEPSQNYYNAINALSLRKDQPKIWYYEPFSYLDSKSTNVGKDGVISVATYERSNRRFSINMPKNFADAHIGFEIVRDGKVIGFTWQNVYTDTTANVNNNYTYTINAYDRSLNQYARCSFNTSTFSNNYVARVNYSAYTSLKDAVNAAAAGDTIYLMDNIYINEPIDINKNLTFTTSDSTKSIGIYYSSWYKNIFNITNGANVTFAPSGTGAKGIVFRAIDYKLGYSLFKVSGGSILTFKPGVYFYDVISYDNGAIVNASGSQVVFDGVIAEHCRTSKDGLVYLSGGSVMTAKNGSIFRYNVANGSGSVVCANSYNDRVYIENTEIYSNSAVNYDKGGTICMNNGTLYAGTNTKIYNNFSDIYRRNSAVYLSKDADAIFSGNLNITDNVNTFKPVKIENNVTGIVTLRAQSEVAAEGFKIASLDSTSPVSSIRYANPNYTLKASANEITLVKGSELKNTSTISSNKITAGKSITVKCSAEGGAGLYKYAVYYKKSGASEWSTAKSYSSTNTAAVTLKNAGTYTVRINAKDADGSVSKKTFTVTVNKVLANSSTVSATKITLGKSVKVTCAASGGAGGYKYAVYYKKSDSSSWTKAQDYKTNTTVSVTPRHAGKYTISVKAKDTDGTVSKKTFTVTVKESQSLKNLSKAGASVVSAGSSVRINFAAENGTEPYYYKVERMLVGESNWVTVKDYTTASYINIKLTSVGTYNIRVTVQDMSGETAVKYIIIKSE